MLRSIKYAALALAMAGALMPKPASAERILSFYAPLGWQPWMTDRRHCGEQVCVTIQVRPVADAPRRIAVTAIYKSLYDAPWCGASRVSQRRSGRAHFPLTIRRNGTYRWVNQHMDAGITHIYVVVDKRVCAAAAD